MIKRNPVKNSQEIQKRKEARMESTFEDSLMTIAEAAKMKGVVRGTIYQAIKDGRITEVTIRGRRYVIRATVESYEPRSYADKR
jgi:excisionase family DNA binding protein